MDQTYIYSRNLKDEKDNFSQKEVLESILCFIDESSLILLIMLALREFD